jgi:hypothetical protein
MRKIFIFLCLFLFVFKTYSQSVFTYDVKEDIIVGTLALGTFISPPCCRPHRDRLVSSVYYNRF